MKATATNTSNDLKNLSLALMSTLDESVFFGEIGKFFTANLEANNVLVRKILENGESRLVSKNGKIVEGAPLEAHGTGAAGHVARTKRPYYSNTAARDPLFAREALEGIKAELCLPIAHEGVVLATLHVQIVDLAREFTKDDITAIQSMLDEVKKPIANMKMYLGARSLNQALMKKIEEKERELDQRIKGLQLADAFRIEEKEIIGKSETLEKILKVADKIAQSDASILIEGEAGSGKELVARRIHCRSSRGACAFVVLDCSAIAVDQLESELFGEEVVAGGTRRSRQGVLESANGGTLLIENIHLMGAALQLKFTQFLKSGVANRLGAQSLYKSNVRIFAASARSLQLEVEGNRFREDLFYALSTMAVRLPALRDHREDIELLSHYFLNNGKIADKQKSLSPEALKSLVEYTWPGNIRELQNVMERAYILADGKIIERDHLADSVTTAPVVEEEKKEEVVNYTEMTLEELEKRHIVFTLGHLGGNKTKTAKSLGITVKTLYNKLHSYGMIRPQESQEAH